jgi:hypothetical protein
MAKQSKPTDPRVKALLAVFGGDLEATWKVAPNRVTYRRLEEQASATPGVCLPKASLWRIINGESSEPDWKMIERFLSLILVPSAEIAGEWRGKFETLVRSLQAVRLTESLSPGAAVEREGCGAAVLNPERHENFHAELEARIRRSMLRTA